MTSNDELSKILSKQGGYEDDDLPSICRNPSHNPPTGLYIPEGKRYRHICPACGYTVVLRPCAISMEL